LIAARHSGAAGKREAFGVCGDRSAKRQFDTMGVIAIQVSLGQ
jgi:hypothetical protein